MHRVTAIATLCLLLFIQCGTPEEPPPGVLSEESYMELLAELALLRNFVSSRGAVHVEDSLRRELFRHYDTSRDAFERSHEWYQRQPDRQLARIDTLSTRLRDLRARINEGQTEWEQLQREIREQKEREQEEQELQEQ